MNWLISWYLRIKLVVTVLTIRVEILKHIFDCCWVWFFTWLKNSDPDSFLDGSDLCFIGSRCYFQRIPIKPRKALSIPLQSLICLKGIIGPFQSHKAKKQGINERKLGRLNDENNWEKIGKQFIGETRNVL